MSGSRDTRSAAAASGSAVGILLAGGRSSRMGRDKASLPYGAESLAARMARLLGQAGARAIAVSASPDGFFAIDRGTIPVRVVADRAWGCGPVMGISCAARALVRDFPGAVAIVVPVDMPLLTPARLSALAAQARRSGAAAYEGNELPLALRLDEAALDVLGRLAQGGAVRELLDVLGAARLPVEDDGALFVNVNTPAEYDEVLRR